MSACDCGQGGRVCATCEAEDLRAEVEQLTKERDRWKEMYYFVVRNAADEGLEVAQELSELRSEVERVTAECRRLDGECKAMYGLGLEHGGKAVERLREALRACLPVLEGNGWEGRAMQARAALAGKERP